MCIGHKASRTFGGRKVQPADKDPIGISPRKNSIIFANCEAVKLETIALDGRLVPFGNGQASEPNARHALPHRPRFAESSRLRAARSAGIGVRGRQSAAAVERERTTKLERCGRRAKPYFRAEWTPASNRAISSLN